MLALGKSKQQFWIVSYLAVTRILGVTLGFWLDGIYGMLIGDAVAVASLYPIVAAVAVRYAILDPICDAVAIGTIVIGWAGVFALRGWTII